MKDLGKLSKDYESRNLLPGNCKHSNTIIGKDNNWCNYEKWKTVLIAKVL